MELVTLSSPELDRLAALQHYQSSRLTQAEVARQLGLSERQIRRLLRRLEAGGPAGLGSRRRGQASNNRLPAGTRAAAIALVRERYADFGPTFAAEKLRALHGLQLSTESLRAAMIAAGLWQPRRKRRVHLHPPRERRPCRGELLQLDGSHHRWFEDRAPRCVLMSAVDDASSAIIAARFELGETSAAYFELLRALITEHGRPIAVYTDRHTALQMTPGKSGQTQVARALAELDIELICAGTPQAKGRVERAFQTLQHRLLREMRLRNINDIDTANTFLPDFIAEYNERFAVAPHCEQNAFRSADTFDLDYILTARVHRTLTKELTFQVGAELYQVTNAVLPARLRGTTIEIDFVGGMRVYRRGVRLTFTHLRTLSRAPVMGRKNLESHYDRRQPNPKKGHPPAADHPWRHRGRFALTKAKPDTSTLEQADI